MKKILSIVLCAIMLLGVFATTASATTESAIPTDIRKFGAYGQGHIFLGEPIVMNFPEADGTIGAEEYAVTYELENLMAQSIAAAEYREENEVSFTMYYSYDDDGYLYAAVKSVSPDYAPIYDEWYWGNYVDFSLSMNQSGDFWAAVSRTRLSLSGWDHTDDEIDGAVPGGALYTLQNTTLNFNKEGTLTRAGWDDSEQATVVPAWFHTVNYDATTELYTCVFEYKINMYEIMESQGVIGTIGDDIMSIMTATDFQIYSDNNAERTTELKGYYVQGILMEQEWIDAVAAAYEDSPYTPEAPWLPDVLHFCAAPTDEAEYIALTGGRPATDAPEGGDEGNTPVDPDAGADLEEEDDEKEDTKKEDTKKEDTTTKAPETTTAAADEAKKGCKGMIGGGAIALVATVGCGVSVISRKKRK